MRVPRVLVEQDLVLNEELELPEHQSKYLSRVLRMEAGRKLQLFNGKGGEYRAEILEVGSKSRCRVRVMDFDPVNRMPKLNMQLCMALSRGDKFDSIIQKSTELGVSAIVPLLSERTEVKVDSRKISKKLDHWQGIAKSACEQSRRNLIPEVFDPRQLKDQLLKDSAPLKIILDPLADQVLTALPLSQVDKVSIYIGPEGGFSGHEIELAAKSGAVGIRLGPRVLRTETAPIAVLSALNLLCET